MKLAKFEMDHINHWNFYTDNIDQVVYDIVIINYGSQWLDLRFRFARFKALCFYESFLDYGETYTKSVEFMELLAQLKKHVPYLMNIYKVESECLDG
jgi:hypothetical protein